MKLADLSWRLRIPLAITAVILATEFVVTALLVTRALRDARLDLEVSASNLSTVLARSLREPLLRDDLWQAFETIRNPLEAREAGNALRGIVVLDAQQRVFVASEPRRLPVGAAAATLPPPLVALVAAGDDGSAFRIGFGEGEGGPELAAARRIRAEDGTLLGTVVLEFDAALHAQRVRAVLVELALLSLPGMLVLVPLGWYAGKRLAEPLAQLAQVLAKVGREPPMAIAAALPRAGNDEIGRLTAQVRSMLDGLARKDALEQEVLASERLAAVGRVSAAIAHEINNPLGGMLNAIDTCTRHGRPDAFTARTLALLERGLQQIRATVSALLVEARLDSPRLTELDWDDLRTLIEPQAAARGLRLRWRVPADTMGTIELPAHEVRQLVLNLLLNACKAAAPTRDDAGASVPAAVELTVTPTPGLLALVVSNTGEPIAPQRLGHLFEPFVAGSEGDGTRSHGLGLWVCWQIVQRRRGNIDVQCEGGCTRFVVSLPIPRPSVAPAEPALEDTR